MIKSITSLLSFLFVISSCYYLVFWSRFNVDVFQYISIEDIIKGVVYSMRSAVSLAIAIIIVIAIALIYEILKSNGDNFKATYYQREVQLLRATIFSAATSIVILGVFLKSEMYHLENNKKSVTAESLSNLADMIPFLAFVFVISTHRLINIYFDNKNTKLDESVKKARLARMIQGFKRQVFEKEPESRYTYQALIQYVSSGALAYFFASAITLGTVNAGRIIGGVEYDYVTDIKQSLIPQGSKTRVIYLGAISNKLIFADTMMRSHYVINRDSVPSLHIHHVSASMAKTASKVPRDSSSNK